jgi:serine/threonine-protein kinase
MLWNTVADNASREPRTDDDQITEPLGSPAEAGAGTRAGASRPHRRDASRYQRIGPYRLFRKLGEGGMGAVYLAGRADDQFRHQVTVKLIKNGTDNEGIVRRFCNERQILAALHHPHIARLLDGGTTDDGAPYFVMEYVEGEPIDEYCNHHKLSIDARLRLFRKVCSAVQYAHQNLVVHRDVKPGNILVDARGEPKLLDFGVAKLLNTELGGQTVALTGRDLMRFMSLPYASPEQILERPITTASDVYSLGVLLYELLSGHRPYRFEGRSLQEIERAICECEPDKPSTAGRLLATTLSHPASSGAEQRRRPAAKQESWRRKLSGDLDNIILKAMRKEPRRRYSSADELSEDVRNYLRGLPVNARPRTLRYLAGKYVRRHKLQVAFIAALTVFSAAMTVLSVRLDQQRQRAESMLSVMKTAFHLIDPMETAGQSPSDRVQEILKRTELDVLPDPEDRATSIELIGSVSLSLGQYESAASLFARALELRDETKDRKPIAESSLHLAQALHFLNDLPAAEDLYLRALALRLEVFDPESAEVAECYFYLGALNGDMGRLVKAEELFRKALRLRQKILPEDRLLIATTQHQLALNLFLSGKYTEAEELFREALKTRQTLLLPDHPLTADTRDRLASIRYELGAYDEAEDLFRRALRALQDRFGAEHPLVAGVQAHLASVLRELGEYEEAENLLGSAQATLRRLLGDQHPKVVSLQAERAVLRHRQGDCGTAERVYTEVLENYRQTLARDHFKIPRLLLRFGELLVDRGDPGRALPHLREAVDSFRKTQAPESLRIARSEDALGRCLVDIGRIQEAEEMFAKSRRIFEANSLDEKQRAAGHPFGRCRGAALAEPADMTGFSRQY